MGLDAVELVLAVEDRFGIEIPDRMAETLVTVGALHGYVLTELESAGRSLEAEVVFDSIRAIIVRQIGIAEKKVLMRRALLKISASAKVQISVPPGAPWIGVLHENKH